MTTTARVLGTTQDVTECGVCGRTELRGTIVLDVDGATVYAGSDCGARLAGSTGTRVRAAAKRADQTARAAAITAYSAAVAAIYDDTFRRLGHTEPSLAAAKAVHADPAYRAAVAALGPHPSRTTN